ncbi:MAG: fluoride efflux transporter CrcB [Crenarchaeota archaeon]|nr:fluoride efflux transporter CrcB [Thermoproteota archaeon]
MEAQLRDALLVAAGGGAGAVARWLLSGVVQGRAPPYLPLGTVAVNVLGSLLLGFVMGAARVAGLFTREQRLLLATGFAGGFTTFSTFSYEFFTLALEAPLYGLLYLAANIIGGLAAVYAGYVAAGVLYAGRPG